MAAKSSTRESFKKALLKKAMEYRVAEKIDLEERRKEAELFISEIREKYRVSGSLSFR